MGVSLVGPRRWRPAGLGAAILLAVPLVAVSGAAPASAAGSETMKTVVVKFQAGSPTQHAASAIAAAGVDRATAERASRYVMRVPASSVAAVVQQLRSSAGVQYAEVAR
ncbi:MAG TPA: hypothetical protein VFN68_12440, partial [Acidimicrobiales bacterium]|nr:hypothetical protein [Acidimicrobiales bacterium]